MYLVFGVLCSCVDLKAYKFALIIVLNTVQFKNSNVNLRNAKVCQIQSVGGRRQTIVHKIRLMFKALSVITGKPASADRTARAANFRRDLEAT